MAIGAIAGHLRVSKGSVSLWVRDVVLTAAQEARLDAANPVRNGQLRGTEVRRLRCREQRIAAQEHGRAKARCGDPLHLAGCMLHWAEGSKRRNAAEITNADPHLIATYVRFLHQCYAIELERLTFSVNCHLGNGLTVDAIQAWWLERLGLPATVLRRGVVNRPSKASKGRKGHVLPYGTARVAVHSTFVAQSIFGAIQHYAEMERPEWVDL